jgi:hypothetical protein
MFALIPVAWDKYALPTVLIICYLKASGYLK